jgi:hypothetical protein
MPLKLDLTEKLIEAENVEAMQNVLDLSIGLIGEEKSLYDLALSFLCLGTSETVFRIHDIFVWIRIGIRGSMPLTNGSGSGSWIRILLFSLLNLKMRTKTNFM